MRAGTIVVRGRGVALATATGKASALGRIAELLDTRPQTMLAAQLGVVLGLRDRLLTRENLFLPAAVAVSAGLAVAALYVPFLRAVLGTVALGWTEIALAAAAGGLGHLAARVGGAGKGGGRRRQW
ncbi:cation transporting ATPase C-terminal domain-containing protein [Streptomyces sp. NBC_00647]|uniref:cation transporting ATPase C-terminal domain-containing protein n=1 Tax=Streptomyces sp. NBC_00647 TaxID=2975796 RepID=UPI0032486B01